MCWRTGLAKEWWSDAFEDDPPPDDEIGEEYFARMLERDEFFSTVPRGKYLVRVCLGTACYVRGGNEVLRAMKDKLGIDVGGTTADRLFSLEVGRCFGACGMAPVLMVNDDLHQRVKPAKLGELLQKYRAGEQPAEEGKP